MKASAKILLVAAAMLVVAEISLYSFRLRTPPNLPHEAPSPASGATHQRDALALDAILRCGQNLRAAKDVHSARRALLTLRAELLAAPAEERVAAIRAFLAKSEDAPTNLPFTVGRGGFLNEHPSLRVFLMDALGQVSSEAAATQARQTLMAPSSPDEWAVSLRNLARGDTSDAGRRLLRERVGQMLSFSSWREHPSTGFLEAFDAIVCLGGTDFVPELASMIAGSEPSLGHAADLTLERLVLRAPATLYQYLVDHPGLLDRAPLVRASLFARANLGNEPEKLSTARYLLQPALTTEELWAFAASFPNGNYRLSDNLIVTNLGQSIASVSVATKDRAALTVIQGWLGDPSFQRVSPCLQKMRENTLQFANGTNRETAVQK